MDHAGQPKDFPGGQRGSSSHKRDLEEGPELLPTVDSIATPILKLDFHMPVGSKCFQRIGVLTCSPYELWVFVAHTLRSARHAVPFSGYRTLVINISSPLHSKVRKNKYAEKKKRKREPSSNDRFALAVPNSSLIGVPFHYISPPMRAGGRAQYTYCSRFLRFCSSNFFSLNLNFRSSTEVGCFCPH